MDDAVATYRAASEADDIDRMMSVVSPDAELISPLSGHMVFRGADDLRLLFGAVYSTLHEMRWTEEFGDGAARVLVGEFRVGPFRGSDAMVFDLDSDGRIRRIRPHLRPWLPTTLFALLLGPKVARRPGVVWRALRAGAGPFSR